MADLLKLPEALPLALLAPRAATAQLTARGSEEQALGRILRDVLDGLLGQEDARILLKAAICGPKSTYDERRACASRAYSPWQRRG